MSESAPNEKQAEYWNGVAGAKWVAKQEALDAQIGPLGLAALREVRPTPSVHTIGGPSSTLAA